MKQMDLEKQRDGGMEGKGGEAREGGRETEEERKVEPTMEGYPRWLRCQRRFRRLLESRWWRLGQIWRIDRLGGIWTKCWNELASTL